MAKALRERVGKQYKGTQRTRKAVHGECTVELAKWTLPIISLSREPYEAKVSRTGLTGGTGRRTVRQRALCLPSGVTKVPGCNECCSRGRFWDGVAMQRGGTPMTWGEIGQLMSGTGVLITALCAGVTVTIISLYQKRKQ